MPSLPSDFPSPTSLIFLQITYLCLTLHDRSCLLVCEPECEHLGFCLFSYGGVPSTLCILGAPYVFVKRMGGQMERTQPGTEVPSTFLLDWHSLQVGGLICAGVLCALGIIIVISAKCKCKFGQKSSHRPGETPPLITPGSAQN
nr:FXYD domain-containing ion transport regulator 3 isoform X1 [Symphalangus syndactylus]